jgi:hypothetical protein
MTIEEFEKVRLIERLELQAELMRRNAETIKKLYGNEANYGDLLGFANIVDKWIELIKSELGPNGKLSLPEDY